MVKFGKARILALKMRIPRYNEYESVARLLGATSITASC
jgi:hypothetical protein